MELFYRNGHSAVRDRDHKIDRLKEYRQKLRRLRDSMQGVDANQIDLKHIKQTLRGYQDEYSDVIGYTKYGPRKGLSSEPLEPKDHVDKVYYRYGKISDTINTMDGAIHRVKREYSEEALKGIYHRGCFSGIWDAIVLVWLIISGISIAMSRHLSFPNLPMALLLVACGLLISSSILLGTFVGYYLNLGDEDNAMKISVGKSSMLIRILNVVTFFAFVIGILSFIASLGMI